MAVSRERLRFASAVRPDGIVAAGESWGNRALVGRVCLRLWRPTHRPQFPPPVLGEIGGGGMMTFSGNPGYNASLATACGIGGRPKFCWTDYWCWLGSQPVLTPAAVSWLGYPRAAGFGGVDRDGHSGRLDSIHMLVGQAYASQDHSCRPRAPAISGSRRNIEMTS